jgi:integrase
MDMRDGLGRDLAAAMRKINRPERLYSLYHLAAYYRPRREELAGLHWADTDLTARRVPIRGDVK